RARGRDSTGFSCEVCPNRERRLGLGSTRAHPAAIIGFLVNPNNPKSEPAIADAQHAAQKLGKTVIVVKAAAESDLDTGFTNFAQNGVEALIVAPDPFFLARREQILALVGRYSLPTIYPFREFASIGGLMT